MDEEVKLIFHRRFKTLLEKFNEQGHNRRTLCFAMCEIAELYAEINGMTFDEASAELHEEDKP